MDISDYLASVQSDPQSKVLARGVTQKGAIPDADNDPSTKDAAGPYSDKWDNLPESENIEDRRNDDPLVSQAYASGGGGRPAMPDSDFAGTYGQVYRAAGDDSSDSSDDEEFARGGEVPDARDDANLGPPVDDEDEAADDEPQVDTDGKPVDKWRPKRRSKRRYAEGGEVEGDEVTEPVTTGAIPDPEQAQAAPEQGTTEQPAPEQEQGGYDRGEAMNAVSDGIEYGRAKRNLNKAVDDGEDNSQNVRAHLTGEGATPNDQAEAALNAADPDGQLGPGDKLLKAIGDVWKFYKAPVAGLADKLGETAGKAKDAMVGDISPEDRATAEGNIKRRQTAMDEFKTGLSDDKTNPIAPIANKAAEAAHGLMSWARKAFNIAGTHATVADDKGNPTAAAKAGEVALNKNLDGLNVQVQAMNDGKYAITIKNPETNKMILTEMLTPEQYKHLFKEGYDKLVHRGVAPQVAIAAQTGEGQLARIGNAPAAQDSGAPGHQPNAQGEYGDTAPPTAGNGDWIDKNGIRRGGNPADHPEDARTGTPAPYRPRTDRPTVMDPEANGLPKGMNLNGLTIGEISQLRRRYAAGQVDPKTQGGREGLVVKERIAGQQEAGRTQRTQMQEEGRNKRNENLRAAPGQVLQNERAYAKMAADRAKAWAAQQIKPPSPEQIDAYENRTRQAYGLPPLQGGVANGPTSPQQAGQPQAPQNGATKEYNGATYVYNAQRGGWDKR